MSESTKSETQSTAQFGAEVPGKVEVPAVDSQVSAPGGVELSEEQLDQVSGGAKFTPSMLTGQPVKVTGLTQMTDLTSTDKEPAWGTDEDRYGR